MSFTEILLIGIALSMDAFAVCLSSGMVYPGQSRKKKMLLPAAFGIFQGIMPIGGFFLGSFFASVINRFSGPVALVILGVIGINMIREGISDEERPEEKNLTLKTVLFQAVATSIDAFAVGVSFAAEGTPIFTAAPIIAATTFILSTVALFIGEGVGKRLGDRAEILGGAILIIIGIKAMF